MGIHDYGGNPEKRTRILQQYSTLQKQLMGDDNKELGTQLALGLERILQNELPDSPPFHGLKYESKFGPEINGRTYQTEEILKMSYKEFLDLHRGLAEVKSTKQDLLSKFMSRAASYIAINDLRLENVTVADVLGISYNKAIKIPYVFVTSISFVRDFMLRNYGIDCLQAPPKRKYERKSKT